MRLVLVLCAVAACARSAAPTPTTPARPPSEADIIARSHAVLDAFDRADGAALASALSPGFVHFEGGAPQTRDALLEQVARRKPGAPYIATRTWEKERVVADATHAVFIGKATETQGGNETKGGYRYVGWYMLQWAREGDAWKLRLWTWLRGGEVAMRDTWNEIYRNGVGYRREPNRLLVATVRGKPPGTALDLAMGQGRNALYLASQGWKVTGVDISDEGIRKAREAAAQRDLALETYNTDIDTFDFGTARWDLVTMIYAGANTAWIEKIKPSLRPGGMIVVEYFAKQGADGEGFAPGELAKLLASGFDIVRDEVVEDEPDWAMDRATLVRFVAVKR